MLERLRILVDGNAQGAIREFEKLGAAADRELGKTDDRLQKLSAGLTNFGATAVAGAAVAAVGLGQLANAAGDYGEALNKATVIVGEDAVGRLEEFSEAASQTAGISKTAALDAAAGFAALGKQAGLTGAPLAEFSTDLVQLAGDLASFNNTTVDESLQALKSGLQGETEPLKRFNIFLNETALKQEYVALTGEKVSGTLSAQQRIVAAQSLIFKQAADAQGDFSRTSDSLANRQRQLQADVENLKTELGQGLVPIFETVVGAVGGITSAFQSLSPEVQKTAGTIAGIGTIGVGVIGGLSLIAGQVIRVREAFTTLGEDGTRSVTRLGKAVQGLGIAAGAVGGIVILDQVLTDATSSAGELEKSINDLIAATNQRQALDALIEGTRTLDGAWEDVKETFGGTQLGQYVNIDDVTVDVIDLTEYLENLSSQPERLQAALDALSTARITETGESLATLGAGGAAGVDRLNGVIDTFRGRLGSAQAAQAALGQQTEITDQQTSTFATTVEGLTIKTDEAKNAFQAYTDLLRASTDPFFAATDASVQYGEAQAKVAEAFAELADGATPEEFEKLAEAQRNAVQAGLQLESAIATIRSEVELGNITYQQAFTTLDALAKKYPELAGAVEQVKGEFFFAAAAAQGLQNEAPIDLPINVEVQQTIERLNAVRVAFEAVAIAARGLQIVAEIANQTAAPGGATQTDIGAKEIVIGRDLNNNGIVGRRFGGPVDPRRLYRVGEAGPELFVPNMPGKIVPNDKLGGNTLNLTQNIQSSDPILTAAEVVRRQRDAEFLAGV